MRLPWDRLLPSLHFSGAWRYAAVGEHFLTSCLAGDDFDWAIKKRRASAARKFSAFLLNKPAGQVYHP